MRRSTSTSNRVRRARALPGTIVVRRKLIEQCLGDALELMRQRGRRVDDAMTSRFSVLQEQAMLELARTERTVAELLTVLS